MNKNRGSSLPSFRFSAVRSDAYLVGKHTMHRTSLIVVKNRVRVLSVSINTRVRY